jgi:MFS family permease
MSPQESESYQTLEKLPDDQNIDKSFDNQVSTDATENLRQNLQNPVQNPDNQLDEKTSAPTNTPPKDSISVTEEPSLEGQSPSSTPSSSNWLRYFNVIVLGIAFQMIFTAYGSAQGYTTVLYQSYGFIILGCIYGTFSISNFVSPILDNRIGSRFAMILASLGYVLYVLSMSLGLWYVTMAASIVLGFSAACLWTSQGAFMVLIAEKDVGLFTGIFFGIQQWSSIIGNLLSALLIGLKIPYWLIFCILGGIGLFGSLLLGLLRPYVSKIAKPIVRKTVKESFTNTLNMLKDRKMLLLLPSIVSYGYNQGVFSGKLPQIVGHDLGPLYVGSTAAALGLAEIIGALTIGKLVDRFGLFLMRTIAILLLYVAIGLTLLMDHGKPWLYYIAFFFVGLSDAALNTTNYYAIGKNFPKQISSAFAVFILLRSLGTCTGLVISIWVPIWGLEAINFGASFIGLAVFLYVEYFEDVTDPMTDEPVVENTVEKQVGDETIKQELLEKDSKEN